MTPRNFSQHLFSTYEQYRRTDLFPSNCKHGVIIPEIQRLIGQSNGILTAELAGHSLQGRSILRVSFGHGSLPLLLWSQMHGDEPTATLAIVDMLEYLNAVSGEEWMKEMMGMLTVHIIPMLNPDGAERFRRYTAAEIDMNRDARALVTPEARLLREAQRTLRPLFGFNLHDQGLSSVGNSNNVSALSLLAPALDEERSAPMGRVRAMRLGALVADVLGQFVGGHLATYDDSYEPRAFGDGMQTWGTSTLLIESGHWPNDPDKTFVRKLNFVALLTTIRAISNGMYQDVDLDIYRSLLPNGRRMMDVIVHQVELRHNGGWSERVDLGLLAVPQNGRTSDFGGEETLYAIKEIGDLRDFGALLDIDASARFLQTKEVRIEMMMRIQELRNMLQL
ncbi:MAG: M14 family zinc carboxypeptidase [Bacteroidota bacterium]